MFWLYGRNVSNISIESKSFHYEHPKVSLEGSLSVRVKVDQPMVTSKDKLKQLMGRVWGTAPGKGERLSIVVEELRRKGGSLTNWLCPPNRAYLIKRSLWKLIVKWWNTITMRVDKVGKEEVQLTHGYINVVRVDAQVGMQTIRRLLQPFTIRRFKWYCFEQDYLDQVESPNLMKQNEKCSFELFIIGKENMEINLWKLHPGSSVLILKTFFHFSF